jgi:hypothetical protein
MFIRSSPGSAARQRFLRNQVPMSWKSQTTSFVPRLHSHQEKSLTGVTAQMKLLFVVSQFTTGGSDCARQTVNLNAFCGETDLLDDSGVDRRAVEPGTIFRDETDVRLGSRG